MSSFYLPIPPGSSPPMAEAVVVAGLAPPLQPQNGSSNGSGAAIDHPGAADIQVKYAAERDKRMRGDGSAQFVDLSTSPEFAYLAKDPWVDHAFLNKQKPAIENGDSIKFLVLGAGMGGLLFAVELIRAGFKASEIRLVDIAGGFGGTWYWNR